MVSVIICTYNHEKFIAQAIESALAQECDEAMEILIGDDCSTDSTRSIVQQYRDKYPDKIRLVYPEHNIGASANIVNLIEATKGQYLAIVDGDDVWIDTQKTQKQLDIMRKYSDVGMVCSGAKIWDETTQQYTGVLGGAYCESLDQLMQRDEDVAAPTLFIRKDLMLRCITDSEWYIANKCFYDSIMTFWFAKNSRIYYISETLAMYRVVAQSASHTNDEKLNIAYERRRYAVKCRFLLENQLDVDYVYSVLMHEWDKTYNSAARTRDAKNRRSKTYRLGKMLMQPMQAIKRIFN